MQKYPLQDIFLDSGAYSAFTTGAEVDIQEYIAFIKANRDMLVIYANLDVIAEPGRMPDETTAVRTLKNQRIMEAAGLDPLPVYHLGEPWEYLDQYVQDYDYVALGVAGVRNSQSLSYWLDEAFAKHICGSDGLPKTRIHGFAVTSLSLVVRYPWYSVDSTSWLRKSRTGVISVPRPWSNALDKPWLVAVSFRHPASTQHGSHHFDALSQAQQQHVLDYCKSLGFGRGRSSFRKVKVPYELLGTEYWCGPAKDGFREVETVEESGFANEYYIRDEINIQYYFWIEKHLPQWPWAFKPTKSVKGLGL